jgi:hypothetical protein
MSTKLQNKSKCLKHYLMESKNIFTFVVEMFTKNS